MTRRLKSIVLLCIFCSCVAFAQQRELRFHHLTVDDGLPKNTIDCFVQDKYGFIWIATLDGLCRFDGYTVRAYPSNINQNNSPVNNRSILLIKDQKGDVWVAFSGSPDVCRYNYETDDFTRYTPDQLRSSLLDSLSRTTNFGFRYVSTKETEWSSLTNNLVQTNRSTGGRMMYQSKPQISGALSDAFVLAICLDKTNVLWVGTDNGGAYYADIHQAPFTYYAHNPSDPKTIIDNTIRAIYEDSRGNVWVGTRNLGVTRINRRTNEYTHFVQNNTDHQKGLTDNQIRRILGDRYGYIWIGTKGGLDRFNPRTNEWKQYTTESSSPIPHNWVYALMEDHEGVLWIGTWNGMARYDRQNDCFVVVRSGPAEQFASIRSIVEDHRNNIWVATENGLILLERDSLASDGGGFRSTQFLNSENDPNSLSDDRVYCLDVDEDGNLWVGTGTGLNLFDSEHHKFIRFTDQKYISDRFITGILCRGDYVWVSHRKGITRLHRRLFTVRHFDKSDGLQDGEFSEDAYFGNASTGELFFGGSNGMNSFFPDSIRDNPYPPDVVLTDLQVLNKSVGVGQKVNGRVILHRPLYLTDELELLYADRGFSVEFAALHFSNPLQNRYAYMLEGYDEDWIDTDASRRTAVYANLPSGTYTFKVKASNSDGVWNETPTLLRVRVRPPWWASVVAYVVYFFILTGLGYLIYLVIVAREKMRHQIQTEKWKAEKMAEMDQLKSDFFTRVSHEFRTPISLIIDPLQKLISERLSVNESIRYLNLIDRNARRLLHLINQLLDFQKVGSGKQELNLVVHDVVPFLKNILSAFEFHASQRQILLKFNCPVESFSFAFDADKLDKILINLLSNAFKYSPDGGVVSLEVSVPVDAGGERVAPEDEMVAIRLCDQGPGIPLEAQSKIFDAFYQVEGTGKDQRGGTGIGLALTRELVTLHQGTISVESEVGKGACFTVSLPQHLGDGKGARTVKEDVPELKREAPVVRYASSVPESQHEVPEEDDAAPPLVLIVEDNIDVREYLRDELSRDFCVLEAGNGEDGWELAVERIPDLVVSDVMMPGISGLDLCRNLKADERTSHIPVILLTARHSEEFRKEGFETGADDYITKPFSSVLLRTRIKSLIESRQKLRELFRKASDFELKKISANPIDEQFILKAVQTVQNHLSDTDFTPDYFARELLISRAQLFRKIKAMTNQTVQEFIITIRLNEATELLLSGKHSIADVSVLTGFTEPSNFTRSYVKLFGLTPSAFIKEHKG